MAEMQTFPQSGIRGLTAMMGSLPIERPSTVMGILALELVRFSTFILERTVSFN